MYRTNQCPKARITGSGSGQAGYTLVELLVVIIIIGVVSAIAFPNFRAMVNGNRLTAGANEMVASLQVARAEAIRRNARTILCPSTNGTACAGTNWGRHIAFVDVNRNNAPDAGEVLRDTSVDPSTVVLASPAISATDRIVFKPDGRARAGTAAGAAVLAGKLSVCAAVTNPAANVRDVEIGAGSRVSVTRRNGAGACAAPSNT